MTGETAPEPATPHPARNDRLLVGVIVALTLLSLTPIWGLPYFPTTDGPSHLESAWILRHWSDAPPAIRETYELNLEPFPNWASHVALVGLMYVVEPQTAERILLTGYVLIWVFSIGYFLRSVGRDHTLYLLLSLPLIHSYLLYMGFYNFVMSVPLAFLMIGYWWRRRARPLDLRLVLALNAMAVGIYFFHLASSLLALGSVLLLAAMRDRFRPRRVLALVAALLPSFALPAYFVISRWSPPGHAGGGPDATQLFGISALFSFDRWSLVLGWVLAGLLAALIVTTLIREGGARRASPGGTRPRRRPESGFALLALIFTAGFFLVPDAMAGGSYVRERVALYPVIAILPWLTARIGPRWRLLVGAVAALITMAQVLLPLPRQARAARGVADYTSGIFHVGTNETVLPLNLLSHVGFPNSRISTYLHPVGYFTMNGAVGLFNYEADTSYFPIRYRPGRNPNQHMGSVQGLVADVTPWHYPIPVDWILVRYPASRLEQWPLVIQNAPTVVWILTHYEPVHQQGEVWLFRRRPGPWPPPAPE